MSAGIDSKRQNFDNLSYISDGRDRISYINDPYAAATSRDSTRDGNRIILQPTELTRSGRENNTSYSYRPGQENIYAYNNAAFRYLRKNIFFSFFIYCFLSSDISGVDSHGPSIRSQHSNLYALQKSFETPKHSRKG